MATITMIKEKQQKVNSKWETYETIKETLTKEQYENYCNFKMKGDRYYRNYTCLGNVPTKIISTSPTKTLRSVANFTIKP